jgi:hypothetical protein
MGDPGHGTKVTKLGIGLTGGSDFFSVGADFSQPEKLRQAAKNMAIPRQLSLTAWAI